MKATMNSYERLLFVEFLGIKLTEDQEYYVTHCIDRDIVIPYRSELNTLDEFKNALRHNYRVCIESNGETVTWRRGQVIPNAIFRTTGDYLQNQ